MKKYIIMTGLLMAAITTAWAQKIEYKKIAAGDSPTLQISLTKTQSVMIFASYEKAGRLAPDSFGNQHVVILNGYDQTESINSQVKVLLDGQSIGNITTMYYNAGSTSDASDYFFTSSGVAVGSANAGTHTISLSTPNLSYYFSGSKFGYFAVIESGESTGSDGASQADLAALETSLRQAIAAGDTATTTALNNALTTYQSQVTVTVNNLQSQIDALTINKNTLASQIAALEQQSDAQAALLAQLQQDLATTQQDLANLTSQFANLSALLNGLSGRVTANEQAIANLQNSLTLVNNQLIAYGLRLDAHGALLDQLGVRLDDHGNLLDTHGNILTEHGALLNQLGVRLDAHDSLLDSHGNLIAKLTTQLKNQDKRQQKNLDRTTDLAWAGVGLGATGAVSAWGYMIADNDDSDTKPGAAQQKTATRPGYNKTPSTTPVKGGNNYYKQLSGQK